MFLALKGINLREILIDKTRSDFVYSGKPERAKNNTCISL